MVTDKEILSQIKTSIHEIIPDGKVYLFGSRARGDWNDESDWDILILTEKKYSKAIKREVEDKLFTLSVNLGTVFQFVITTNIEWQNAPEFYSLYKGVGNELLAL